MKRGLVFLILITTLTVGAFAQGQNPSIGYSGTLCTGQTISFYLSGSQTCGSISVSSNSNWTFNPAPASVTYSTDHKQVQAKWNTVTTVYVNVSYSCSTGGGGSTGTNVPINPGPSLGAAIGSGIICQNGAVELDVVSQQNVGVTPTYEYYVDNNLVHSGSETKYNYYVSGISVGSHSAYIKVTSGGAGSSCTAIALSQPVAFNVTANETYTASVRGPLTFCPVQGQNPAFYVDVSTSYTTPTYQWYANGYPAGTTNPVTIPISQQTNVYCVVTQPSNSSHPCVVSPVTSNTFLIDFTPSVKPTVQIQSIKYVYCTGETVSFGAVGQNLTGSPSYAWYLDGKLFSLNQSPPALPVATVASDGVFGPGSEVRVDVSNITGSCLTTSTATYTLPANAITVYTTPHLNDVPDQSICSGQNFAIPLDYSVTGTTYQWTQTSTNVSGSADSQGAFSGASLSQALSTASGGFARYTITPTANGCVGNHVVTVVNVNPIPALPQFSLGGVFSRCSPGPVTLTAQPGTYGTEVHWYDGAGSNASLLANTNSLLQTISMDATYYASSYNNSTTCESARLAAQALVKDKYTAPVNSVITQQVLLEGVDVNTDISAWPTDKMLLSVQYFDGLGRHYQDVLQQNSVSGTDLVQSSVYDQFGREYKKYLPVTVAADGCPKDMDAQGNYVNTTAKNFYSTTDKVASDEVPFSQTNFEPSPLNRVLQDMGPGKTWSDNNKFIGHQYLVNRANEVLFFTYDYSAAMINTGSAAAYYDAGQLQAKITTDEEGNEVREYTDKLGHLVCKKVQYKIDDQGVKQYTSTYYVYDDLGNLAIVLPPEAVKKIISQLN